MINCVRCRRGYSSSSASCDHCMYPKKVLEKISDDDEEYMHKRIENLTNKYYPGYMIKLVKIQED